MNKKIIICGATASGKDYLLNRFSELTLSSGVGVKHTTRPMRNNEIEGKSYHFTCNTAFDMIKDKDQFYVYQEFYIDHINAVWKYGFTKLEINTKNIFMFTPAEIKSIPEEHRNNFVIVYLDIDINVRRSRLLRRGDTNDNIDRRLNSDLKDFENFYDADIVITDPNFKFDEVVKIIADYTNEKYPNTFDI